MNAFQNYFNPMSSFQQGADFINQADEAAWRNQERKRMLAQRQALSDFGQGGYLTGFEGVQGAERAPDLQALYRENPEAAMQIEQTRSIPFAEHRKQQNTLDLQRDKIKQGWGGLAEFLKAQGLMQGAPGNAFSQQWAPHPITGMGTDQGMAPGGGVLAPPPRPSSAVGGMGSGDPIDRLSGMKYSVKTNAEGMPMAEVDYESPFSRELRTREDAQKARQLELNASKTGEDLEAGREARIQTARENVNKYAQEISALELKAHDGVNVRGQLEFYRNKLSKEESRLQRLEGGGTSAPSSAQLTPEEKAMAAQAKAKKPSASGQPMAAPSTGLAGVGQGLPPKQRIEAQAKNTQEKLSIANKTIEDAHSEAMKAQQLDEPVKRMLGIVDKGIGSTFAGALPFGIGETLLTIGHDYKRLKSLNSQMMDMYKKEGETKSYDTLPELKIVAARIPDVDKGEDQNREDMVGMINLLDARKASGDFLESWAKVHGGTIDGARAVLRGWMQHSPLLQVKTNNGRVSIEQNPHYIPLETWTRLRQQFSDRDIVKMRDSNKLQIIGGKVFVDK